MTDNAKKKSKSVSLDQNFKNLILDYPVQSNRFFAEPEAGQCGSGARIVPIRQEQLKDRLGDRSRELDVLLLVVFLKSLIFTQT